MCKEFLIINQTKKIIQSYLNKLLFSPKSTHIELNQAQSPVISPSGILANIQLAIPAAYSGEAPHCSRLIASELSRHLPPDVWGGKFRPKK